MVLDVLFGLLFGTLGFGCFGWVFCLLLGVGGLFWMFEARRFVAFGFGCLSMNLDFLKPGMRADLNIYLLLGVIHICTLVM